MAETPEKVEVVMEVDVESLKPYFDNISEGFAELSKRIRNLRIGLALTSVATLINGVSILFF